MKDLQNYEVRAIQERATEAIDKLQAIVKECDQMYQSRRYIMDKAAIALERVRIIHGIAVGEDDG